MIRLVTSIKNPQTRHHFDDLLTVVAPRLGSERSAGLPEFVDLGIEPESLFQRLRDYFAAGTSAVAVLISDWLLSTPLNDGATTLASRCQAAFANNIFGMVAITSRGRRFPDIDRTISPECTAGALEEAVGLVIDRLDYLSTPAQRLRVDCGLINVRRIRTNETEFLNYFMLRHRVYTIMGYLDEELVNTRSRLEVNEADVHGIHWGAFYRQGVQEKLVGTARVVTNGPPDAALHKLFSGLVINDPVAKQRLNTPYLLGLPIFQSHQGMNSIMSEVLNRNEVCGELSRVIVAPEFRGNRISQKLIDKALEKSISDGAQRMFLECLQVHETLYEKHGFQRIPGVIGPVVDVGRTMIAMQMRADAIQKIQAGPHRLAMAKAI